MGVIAVQHSSPFYPRYGIASMQSRHGYRWRDLVDWLCRLSASDPHVMALARTLRQIDRSMGVKHADAHHEPFCTLCAAETLAAFEGSEDDLLVLYYRNLYDINRALSTMRVRGQKQADAAIA